MILDGQLKFFILTKNGNARKKHEWKCVIESTCLVTSLHLVQARMVKTCPKKVNKKKYIFVH